MYAIRSYYGTEHDGRSQRGEAAHSVYNQRAGKIIEAHLVEPASAPLPVAGNRINERGDNRTVYQIGVEFKSSGNRTGNNGGRRITSYNVCYTKLLRNLSASGTEA